MRVDIRFDAEEMLYRTYSRDQWEKSVGRLKPNSLRLQLSVHRSSRVASLADFPLPPTPRKFNGVAAISVTDARNCDRGAVRCTVIDEPTAELPAHALIALWTEAGPDVAVEADIECCKSALANGFGVLRQPT